MWDVSLAEANWWNDVSWYGQFIAAALVVVCLAIQFWSGNLRDRYADAEQAKLKAETARALESAATANLRNEELRNENLRLAAVTAPRTLGQPEADRIATKFKGSGLYIDVVAASDMEAEQLASEYIAAFKRAGLKGSFGSFDPYKMRARSYGIQWMDPKGPDTFFMRTMSEIFPQVTEFNKWQFDQPHKHPTVLVYLKPSRPISGEKSSPETGEW